MLKFISFGSGSSGNCYYLFTENNGILIDTGIGIRTLKKYFKDRSLNIEDVNNILITHDHADHIKSVGSISYEYGLSVYATHKVHTGITRSYCVQRKIQDEHIKLIEKGAKFQLGDFSITSFGVPHDSSDNVGYRIEVDNVVFCLMTDAGHVTEEMCQYISDSNYLVIEANHDIEMLKNGNYPQYLKDRISGPDGHLCNTDCGTAIAENMTEKLHHIWLCHLSEENNHPELARKTVESTLRSYGIIIGKDVELDVLRRKIPSEIYELK
jgi:phosphoribosyl 1,2-cyclic phosphodiesterase